MKGDRTMNRETSTHYRVANDGRIVIDERQPGPTAGTSGYKPGDPLFTPPPTHSSPSRINYRAERVARRAAARAAKAAPMHAVHDAAQKNAP